VLSWLERFEQLVNRFFLEDLAQLGVLDFFTPVDLFDVDSRVLQLCNLVVELLQDHLGVLLFHLTILVKRGHIVDLLLENEVLGVAMVNSLSDVREGVLNFDLDGQLSVIDLH